MKQILSKVKNLEKFIEKHGDDTFISQSISKILNYKIAKYEEKIQELCKELKSFERAYGMKSSVFFKKFTEGKIGDDMDFIEWSSIYQMYQRLLEKKDALKGKK